jgi:hypothetical protein
MPLMYKLELQLWYKGILIQTRKLTTSKQDKEKIVNFWEKIYTKGKVRQCKIIEVSLIKNEL